MIPGNAKLSVEHEVEGRDAELELQLSWKHTREKTPAAQRKATKKRS